MLGHPKAYEGKDPFVFISYCHKDEDAVMSIVAQLAGAGVRLWYDSGIDPGTEWPEVIANHLSDSAGFVAFVSEYSLASHNCRREFNYAIMENKPSLIVFLEQVEMTPVMKMQMSTVQALDATKIQSQSQLVAAIRHAPVLLPCIDERQDEVVAQADERQDDAFAPADKWQDAQVEFGLIRRSDGKKIAIDHDGFTVGRKSSCDLVVGDSAVSRVHALFHISAGRLHVVDNESLNHTYVNDKVIEPKRPVAVSGQDRIEIGDEVFVVFEVHCGARQ